MPLLLQRNPLAYPAGRPPGFDPTHPAAHRAAVSCICSNTGVINLLNAKPFTADSTFGLANVDSVVGPAPKFTAGTAGTSIAISSPSSVTSFTTALIFRLLALNASQELFINDTKNNGLRADSTGLLYAFLNATGVSTGITLTAGVPYFVAVSALGGSSVIAVVVNLSTGATISERTTTAATVGGSNTILEFGGANVANYQSSSAMAAGMIAYNNLLSLPQLLAWAQCPWEFWYPPHIDDYLFSLEVAVGIRASPPSPPQNPGKMMVMHFPGSGSR